MSSESFDEPFIEKNVFSLCLVNVNSPPNQMAGLGYGRDNFRVGLNADLISLNISHGTHPGGKFYDDDCLFTGIE